MPELGEAAQAALELQKVIDLFEADKARSPDSGSIDDALKNATLLLEGVTPRARQDFEAVLRFQPEEDPEIAKKREIIESIRDSELYKKNLIAESFVQEKLDELPPPPERFSDDIIAMARSFLGVASLEAAGVVLDTSPPSDHLTTEASAQPEQQSQVPVLSIVHFSKDNMLLVDQETAIPIARRSNLAKYKASEELLVEEYRLAALKLLADKQSEDLLRGDGIKTELTPMQIWEAIDHTGTAYDSSTWNTFINEFLETDLTHNGDSLVSIRRPTPEARVRYYSLNNCGMTFETLDEDSRLEQLTLFKMPDGTVVGGKEGMLLHLLRLSGADSPITQEVLRRKGFFEDLANGKSEAPISSIAAGVRARIRNAGLDPEEYLFRISCGTDAETSRPVMGYWMKDLFETSAPANGASTGAESDLKNGNDIQQTTTTGEDIPSSLPKLELDEAEKLTRNLMVDHMLARYITARNRLLAKLDLPELDCDEMITRLSEDITLPNSDSEEFSMLFEEVSERINSMLENPQCFIESIFDSLPQDDLRWPLYDYLFGLLTNNETATLFKRALEAEVIGVQERSSGKKASSKILGVDFEVEGAGMVSLTGTEDGETLIDDAHLAYLCQYKRVQHRSLPVSTHTTGSTKHTGCPPDNLSKTEREAAERQDIEHATTGKIRDILKCFSVLGLIRKVDMDITLEAIEFVYDELDLTVHDLQRVTGNSRITLNASTPIELKKAVALVLSKDEDPSVRRATTSNRQKRMLFSHIEKLIAAHAQGVEARIKAGREELAEIMDILTV